MQLQEKGAGVRRVHFVLWLRCTVGGGGRCEEASGSCYWMVSSFLALLAKGRLPLSECVIWSLLTPLARVFSLNIF